MVDQQVTGGIPFEELADADLVVDREYLGGSQGSMADDPIARLLPVGTLGGFRYRGSRQAPQLVVLYTSGAEADWPDELDLTTGTFTYYGDNRQPGKELHDSPRGGNTILRQTFDLAHGDLDQRRSVPPYFLFSKAGRGRDVVFRGVLAPGAAELTMDEDLVAVWRNRKGKRFQNYRAKLTVLDIATASRAWIGDILSGNPLSAKCPRPWRRWVTGRHYEALISTRIEYRSPQDQQPCDQTGKQILDRIYTHFASRPGQPTSSDSRLISGRWPTGTSALMRSLKQPQTVAATLSANTSPAHSLILSASPSPSKPSCTTPQEEALASKKSAD